jgi:hypothetical protein
LAFASTEEEAEGANGIKHGAEMSTAIAKTTKADIASNSLSDLAARIREEHAAAGTALRASVRHAIAAGELLIEAKSKAGHGQWLCWLTDDCDIPERTAQAYMRMARLPVEKRNAVADLPLREALSAIGAREKQLAQREAVCREHEKLGPPCFIFEGPGGEKIRVPAPGFIVAPEHRHLIPPSKPRPTPPPPPTEDEIADFYMRQLAEVVAAGERPVSNEVLHAAFERWFPRADASTRKSVEREHPVQSA